MVLQMVSIGYILFNPQTVLFVSYGGAMSENNLNQPKVMDIYRNGTLMIFNIMGLNLLKHTLNEPL